MPSNRRCTNTWRPLTCDCLVEFEFTTDANDVPIDATTKVIKVHRTCARHASTAFQVDSHPFDATANKPRKDQKLHNDSLIELLSRLTGNANYTFTDPQSGTVQLKDTAVAWSFDAQGVLVLTFTPNLSGAQRNTLQTACDQKVGANQVRIA
jgi:hypothetical protein